MGRMVVRLLFFAAGLRAFGAQAVCMQKKIPMLQASFTVLESWTILDLFCTSLDHTEPFQIILDHFKPPCTISKAPMTSH